jgi:hypothetical protein
VSVEETKLELARRLVHLMRAEDPTLPVPELNETTVEAMDEGLLRGAVDGLQDMKLARTDPGSMYRGARRLAFDKVWARGPASGNRRLDGEVVLTLKCKPTWHELGHVFRTEHGRILIPIAASLLHGRGETPSAMRRQQTDWGKRLGSNPQEDPRMYRRYVPLVQMRFYNAGDYYEEARLAGMLYCDSAAGLRSDMETPNPAPLICKCGENVPSLIELSARIEAAESLLIV